jgi:hypothetical protein
MENGELIIKKRKTGKKTKVSRVNPIDFGSFLG